MNLSPMAVGCRSMIYLSSHKPTKALHALILAMATALLIGGSAMAAKANRAPPPSLPPASQAGPLPQALHEDEKKQHRNCSNAQSNHIKRPPQCWSGLIIFA
jgi:hypothetical protein